MRLVASCQGSCSMDARLTIISACLSLLPPLGLALYSCVHLPSSFRASSKRYWSLSFSRVLFPVLFYKQVPENRGPGPQHTERNVFNSELKEAWKERRNMKMRDKKGSKGCCPEFGGLERNVLGKGKYMNEFSWVISGECCNRVRKASLSAASTRGSWGGSLPDRFFLPFCILGFGPWAHIGLDISLKQVTNRPRAGLQASPFFERGSR